MPLPPSSWVAGPHFAYIPGRTPSTGTAHYLEGKASLSLRSGPDCHYFCTAYFWLEGYSPTLLELYELRPSEREQDGPCLLPDASRHGFAAWLSTTHRHFARLCSVSQEEYSTVPVTCMLPPPTAAASSHIINSLSHHEFMGAARAAGVCGLCLLHERRMG